ncbi:RbsD/FucU family protein [Cognatishimia sp. WU-CL00825]|uniref:RbsD/FucU family protein n=1 Tax=Cognatishimia sp. WU-CL00825 TaxID=3127658 RepID=UPI0031056462
MLKNIDPILSPDLLHVLRSMGHGDELVVVDANFPATSHAQRMVRLEGVSATHAVQAILSLMPLDTYVDAAVFSMENAADVTTLPRVVQEFQDIVSMETENEMQIQPIERFGFYDRAKTAFAIVQTAETRHFGNLILKKGVLADTA